MVTSDFTQPNADTLDFTRQPLKAAQVSYVPGNPSDWTPPPTNVQDALDTLAASGGGGGGTSDTYVIRQEFSFSDPTPLDFGSVMAGAIIIDSDVVIQVPFDDPTALLALGTVANPGQIMTTANIDAQNTGTYSNPEDFEYASTTQMRLNITPGASTQGSGEVIVTVRRP